MKSNSRSCLWGAVLILLLGSTAVRATPYATYNGDVNQSPANPVTQGWVLSGGLNQGVNDGGTLGWELNDNNGDANPTMSSDYGAGNEPAPGDPWSFSVNARVLPGNGSATNVIMWSDGTERYLFFLYEDATGNIDLLYWDSSGSSGTLQDVAVNDDGYHDWAIVHDGTSAKITYDGADVVATGPIGTGSFGRGVYVGGGSSSGQGALYVASASYDATLAGRGVGSTTLARVFADHMVLQRGEPVAVFGNDSVNAGSQVISVTFDGQTKNTVTDGEGNWRVDLDPMLANPVGQSLVVTGSSVTTISDVLIGEVWLAAGQSNMNWTVNNSSTPPHASTYPLIRMCNWEGTVRAGGGTVYDAGDFANLTPENFYAGTWQVMDASSVVAQSGVAYFFAHNLAVDLNVPIGIVDVSYGGTSTEAFIGPAFHQSEPHLLEAFKRPHVCRNLGQWTSGRIFKNVYNNDVGSGNYTHPDPALPHPHPLAPGFLHYTSMPHIVPFTFKGAIWYQGESNAEFTSGKFKLNGSRLSDYQTLVMKTLVESMRTDFEKPEFPFYMVELPRISASNRVLWPYYREAQGRVATEMEGVEVARVIEYGVNGSNVHPGNKEPVGERLAAIARAKLYGDAIVYSGPACSGQTIVDDKIVLHFDHVGSGLVDQDGGGLRNFEIAGLDRNFVAATAVIVGETIEVSSAGVAEPVTVRHAWEMNPDVDLYNSDGFSSSSFRTDRWIVAPGRTIRVACIGDSITAGLGIPDAADRYPEQLGRLLGTSQFEVRNYGKSGAGIQRASNRYDLSSEYADAIAWEPDVVICSLGINDITDWGSYTQEEFETEYLELTDSFIQSGSVPMFIQWSPLAPLYPGHGFHGDPDLMTLAQWIEEAAGNTSNVLFDMETPLSGNAGLFLTDAIHPNEAGALEIAESTFCLLDGLGQMDGVAGISEFMAINTVTLQDEDGVFSDWIELCNTGSEGLCLDQHHLTDDMGDLARWQIPASTVIEPGGKLLVFASGKDRAINNGELHTDFTLADTGGSLALVAPDGVTILDAYDPYPLQHADVSYGQKGGGPQSFVGEGAPVAVHAPADGALGVSWMAVGFDDAAWTSGTSGVGYDGGQITFAGDEIWNGGFLNGWTEVNGSGTTEMLTGSVLTYDHTGQTNANTLDGTNSGWPGSDASWGSINQGDWTFEVNLRLTACPNGFKLWLGTDTKRVIVEIFPTLTKSDSGSFSYDHTLASTENTDGAFHLFRITHDSGAERYHVWRDGVLLTPVGGVSYDSTGSDSRLLLGDSTSGTDGNEFNVDIASVSYTGQLYAGLVGTNVDVDMQGINGGAYVRMPFLIAGSPAEFHALNLDIKYDDGFVAYLNGVEVARRNAPVGPVWDSVATADRSDPLALIAEEIDLSAHLAELVSGVNVLAIHGLNADPGADRFLVDVTLSGESSSGTVFFQTPSPGAGNGLAGTGPYATWKSVFGVLSDEEDLDRDGLSAMMEFFTGGDPGSSESEYPSPLVVEDGGMEYLGCRFRVANGLAGLDYELESSENLMVVPGWLEETDAVLVSSEDNGDGSSTVTWRLPDPMSDLDRKFVRTRFSYSE